MTGEEKKTGIYLYLIAAIMNCAAMLHANHSAHLCNSLQEHNNRKAKFKS
jgi:hypothetical protein